LPGFARYEVPLVEPEIDPPIVKDASEILHRPLVLRCVRQEDVVLVLSHEVSGSPEVLVE
jgi:hypothetical protein